jgi:hypothetical protein
LPIGHDDREDRAKLDRDLECLFRFALKAEQGAGQNEMAGGGNGDEFGQPFEDAEKNDDKDGMPPFDNPGTGSSRIWSSVFPS